MHTNSPDLEPTQSNIIDPKSPRYCLNANLRQACRVIMSFYADAMRESELQGTQFTLLSTISGLGETTVGQLSEFMVMDQTTVTRSINLLKKAGHIEVVPGEDRRTRVIRLTPQGQETVQVAYPLWRQAQSQVWDALGEDKAQQLLALSQQITALGKIG